MSTRRLSILMGFALLVCGAVLAFAQASGGKGDPARIARGRYLAQIMSCGDCHTPGTFYGAPDTARAYAGSEMGWKGPWGVKYAANLTPDLDTGIGYWTAAEFAKTLRTGVRPDGSVLGPPMPMDNIRQLSDDDAQALAAFFMNLKPVSHAVPKAVKPGVEAKGPVLEFPAPPAWDAPRAPAVPAPDKK
ncbi:MAG: cytochrome c [Candidatus Eisenbacteria bacterium]